MYFKGWLDDITTQNLQVENVIRHVKSDDSP